MKDRRNRKYCSIPFCIPHVLLTHILAVIFGITWMALFQRSSITNNYYHNSELLGPGELLIHRKKNSTNNNNNNLVKIIEGESSIEVNKFDLLPIIILEHEWKVPTLKQFVYDVQARVRIPSVVVSKEKKKPTVGPLYVCVPERKTKVYNYLKKELSRMIDDNIVILQLIKGTKTKRDCFFSISMWKNFALMSYKVFVLDEYVALCGNPTNSALYYTQKYDWIGAAWS